MSPATPPPPKRFAGLEIREAADGFVVYDPRRDRLHFLNGTALFILECLDGATGVDDLPALVAAAFRLPGPPVDEVAACLERFAAEGLIDPDPAPGSAPHPAPTPQSR